MQEEVQEAKIALSISSRPGRPASENPIYRGASIAMEALAGDETLPVPLRWKVFDDHGNPETTKEMARQIIADPAFIGVVGPMGSSEALANAATFHEAGIVQVSPCASHPDLCKQGYRTFFRLVANEDVQGHELARVAREYLRAQRVAVVYADDAWGTTVSAIFGREFESLGGEIVARQSYASAGQEDYAALVQAVAEAEPDLVFLVVHPIEGLEISTSLRERGLTVPFLGTDAMKTQFPLGGGEENAEAYHTYSGSDFRRLSGAAAFRAAYASRFPEDSTYSPEGYDAVMIIAEALRRAGRPDREAVLREVRKMRDYEGVSGTVNFDPSGERVDAPVSLYRVQKSGSGREMAYLGRTWELLQS